MPATAPLLWIDATRPAAGWRLWGMNPVERLLREAARRGVARAVICVTRETAAAAADLRPDLDRLYAIARTFVEVADGADAWRRLAVDAAGPVLALEGDVVCDDRVLEHLLRAGPGTAVRGEGVAAAFLAPAQAARLAAAGVGRLADAPLDGVRATPLAALGDYVPQLRLTMAPFLVRLTDAAGLRRVDRLLFHRTFKGVIDAVARYGYYHFVRFVTRQLSRTTVAPNLLTALSILGIWAAIPCFASGRVGWGAAAAWVAVLLDSIDGKLARLTVHLSDAMGALEHATAMPGLGLWFVALGWHLTDGDLLTPSPASFGCWVLVGAFLLDKLLSGAFKSTFGGELFDARPVDAAFHLVAARRNIHLVLITAGALAGAVEPAYWAMAGAMAATLGFHAVRFAWIAGSGARREGLRG